MPLDVARLRDSELTTSETPEACWAALLLWCTSWHQVPAASLPDDEKWIADKAGYVARGKVDKAWKEVRPGAMRGWVMCTDGRYYHPVVAEKARDAWQAKLKQRWLTECGRIKKHNDRHDGANVQRPTFEDWIAAGCPQGQPLYVPGDTGQKGGDVPRETHSKRQGEGQGQGQGQGQPYSVPTGTDGAGAPAVDKPVADMTQAELWKVGKSVLMEAGVPEAQCSPYVGALVKEFGNDIAVRAMRATVLSNPPDPRAYLKATCIRMKKEQVLPPRPPIHEVTVPSDEAEKTRAMLKARDEHWKRIQAERAARLAAEATGKPEEEKTA